MTRQAQNSVSGILTSQIRDFKTRLLYYTYLGLIWACASGVGVILYARGWEINHTTSSTL